MIKNIKLFIGLLLMLASILAGSTSHATVISVSDWHLTTDGFNGLKQAQLSEDVFFAVSNSNIFDPNSSYEMLSGYHWASSDEYISLIGETMSPTRAYYNQGGWNGYDWEGLTRYQFFFSDTQTTDRIQHAGNFEYAAWVRDVTSYHQGYGNDYFAGFVLVKDLTPVPEPGTMLLFGSGLVGLVVYRRRLGRIEV